MKTTSFKIDGMSCDGCAQTIRRIVEQQPGVQSAAVSFKDKEARVLYDSKAIAEDQLVAAIERPGFRVIDRK